MSSKNPFTTAENGEQSGKTKSVQKPEQRENQQPNGRDQPPKQQDRSVDLERVEELEKEIEELRDRVEEAEPPEPDFGCANPSCEGFAVEEVEPAHVVTRKKLIGSSTCPKVLNCPRCGESMKCSDLLSVEEQKARYGSMPPISNNKSAGRALREKFEENGQGDVLEEADSKQ